MRSSTAPASPTTAPSTIATPATCWERWADDYRPQECWRTELMDSAVALLTIFVLAVFVGIEVRSKVSSTLHTPLMSGANAIHGIILVGAVIVAGRADSAGAVVVALVAVVLATVNLVGGFVVTDRMLEMFRGRPVDARSEDAE